MEQAFVAKYVAAKDKVVDEVGKKGNKLPKRSFSPPSGRKCSGSRAGAVHRQGVRDLFYTKANCFKCHGPSQLGDGQTTDYDDWTKPLVEMAKQVEDGPQVARRRSRAAERRAGPANGRRSTLRLERPEYDALPPCMITPRNLRLGIYRGCGGPLDLYRRFHAGINGDADAQLVRNAGNRVPDDIWNLVDLLCSLPYELIEPAYRASPRLRAGNNFRTVCTSSKKQLQAVRQFCACSLQRAARDCPRPKPGRESRLDGR